MEFAARVTLITFNLHPLERVATARLEAGDGVADGEVCALSQPGQFVLPQSHQTVVDQHRALEADLCDTHVTS